MMNPAAARWEEHRVAGTLAPLAPACVVPVSGGRPIRVGAISNPASGRNLRADHFGPIRRVLDRYPEAERFEADRPEEIIAAARHLADRDSQVIVVSGGDGTVQAVLTGLLTRPGARELPLLLLVPGGTTNMIAHDVGSAAFSSRAVDRLLADARDGVLNGSVVERSVMCADFPGAANSVFGMFFGTGAVYHGIQLCRRRIHTLGMRGEVGPGLVLLILLVRHIWGRAPQLLPPLRASGELDSKPLDPQQEYFGLLVTTLDRLFLGLRPYWGSERGSLRYTSIGYRPRKKLWAAPAVMRGRPNRFVRPEFGYASHNADVIRLRIDTGFTLDGELFAAPTDGPIVLRGGARAFFLRPPVE